MFVVKSRIRGKDEKVELKTTRHLLGRLINLAFIRRIKLPNVFSFPPSFWPVKNKRMLLLHMRNNVFCIHQLCQEMYNTMWHRSTNAHDTWRQQLSKAIPGQNVVFRATDMSWSSSYIRQDNSRPICGYTLDIRVITKVCPYYHFGLVFARHYQVIML
jgi:hypothetical protein